MSAKRRATGVAIRDVRWCSVRVSDATRWSFVAIVDARGRAGFGEATLGENERAMARLCAAYGAKMRGLAPADVDLSPQRGRCKTLAAFAVVSALDQALCDLDARQRGLSVGVLLGGRRRDLVPVYAKVNRGVVDRSPRGFATQAARAIADGFAAVKIAPFDGIELRGDAAKRADAAVLARALARIAAVREAIGPEVALMVDCHWRLNRAVAERVIDAVAPWRLDWLECPLPETPAHLEALCALRARANRQGMRLAGCETMTGIAGFLPFVAAGTYDVMMPDVKYVGGMREMLAVATLLAQHGVVCSPHNPSGPIAHAASLQACAAAERVERLEMQYRETPHFDALVAFALPAPVASEIAIPDGPGFGAQLDADAVAALAGRRSRSLCTIDRDG